ncbi:methyltransferase domain-containing protein [Auraticoccus sp. F435]|uniref:Protein-L-isoaspartate O-methyltransferase n=1 Tax=Auraticoccus cholistanensis TaxID=2656650 RepID=A0A6A9V1M4_9ACTN|nr:methyltransferase domain-containing protein [Auraticoccus cholistanensis]MVA77486.1 methyltransferase domain-containing protein [Auraticoccus cholistanensis]
MATAQQRVDEALAAVPRSRFLPEAVREAAAEDRPLPIGHGATCSQPTTVRHMLVLLDVHPGQRVLDVGSGSGWTTALLAHLVGPAGEVLGVELEPELVETARPRLTDPWSQVVVARPGVLGAPDRGPWDRVLVSAEGTVATADVLAAQLADGGRLICPVGDQLLELERHGDQVTRRDTGGSWRFVPLR